MELVLGHGTPGDIDNIIAIIQIRPEDGGATNTPVMQSGIVEWALLRNDSRAMRYLKLGVHGDMEADLAGPRYCLEKGTFIGLEREVIDWLLLNPGAPAAHKALAD